MLAVLLIFGTVSVLTMSNRIPNKMPSEFINMLSFRNVKMKKLIQRYQQYLAMNVQAKDADETKEIDVPPLEDIELQMGIQESWVQNQ